MDLEFENYFKLDFGENFYDEVDITEFEYENENKMFYYPCPCGDRFEISLEDLLNEEIVAKCPSCSLIVRIVYENEDLKKYTDL